jgi:beta-aspartyl-peptidase (threonine type)
MAGVAVPVALAWGAPWARAGEPAAAGPPPGRFAIAIHGGAGVIAKTIDETRKEGYLASLRAALALGRDMLAGGATALDTVEQVVRLLEDDPRFNAGRGAVFTHEGTHELDAAIMDGRDLSCGAVSGLRTVRNPISLARLVMEKTPHVFLAGDGAEAFAAEMSVPRVDPSYFSTPERREAWQEALRKEAAGEQGTVGAVALDVHGNLAAGPATGGQEYKKTRQVRGGPTNKKHGRVGDVPVIGAGTYADNRACAVSGTGKGEQFIRHGVARDIAARMIYRGASLREAVDAVIHEVLRPGDGGVIAVDREGNLAIAFNTAGMFRGAADSGGRFEVAIWE